MKLFCYYGTIKTLIRQCVLLFGALAFIGYVGGIGPACAADITWLGTFNDALLPPDNGINANADGTVIVGWSAVTNGYFHAFRWTQTDNTMHDLGTLGGAQSNASGVNANGSVVVGWADLANGNMHAYRWTQSDNTMHDLGTLGGARSNASGVNANGLVVVGWADLANSNYHAFRWTQSDNTMRDLGTLGGQSSAASGVNLDGSVVVGSSSINLTSFASHAFRWTQSDNTMRDLGTLGGQSSAASGVNLDGSVVIGLSNINLTSFASHAFRWTQSDNTMHDLGTLGGRESCAYGVNANGSVVVGWANLVSGDYRAFRWTQSTGMQSVEDWIVANGGSPLATGNYLVSANGVSAEGNIVVGYGKLNGTGQAFIARVAGVLGLADFQNSLMQPTVTGSILHNRLQEAVSIDLQNNAPRKGKFAFSSQGIYDGYTRDMADGNGLSGVFKLIYGISDSLRAGVSYIRAGERLDMGNNGRLKNDIDIFGGLLSYGDYKGDGLRGRVSLAYGTGHANLSRDYLTGSSSDQSTGHMGVNQYGYAAEIGYGFLAAPKTLITPMASYEWVHSKLGGYTESGGAFPAQFDGRILEDSYVRGGVKATQSLSSVFDINFNGHYVMRLSSTRGPVSGSLVGLGTMGVFGQNVQLSKDWVELRAGIDYVPEWVSKNLHVTLGYQVDLGQRFDVPTHRVDTGFVIYF